MLLYGNKLTTNFILYHLVSLVKGFIQYLNKWKIGLLKSKGLELISIKTQSN